MADPEKGPARSAATTDAAAAAEPVTEALSEAWTGDSPLDVLLTHSASGDQEAFAALYDRVAPTVLGLCRRILRDASHAEEVAQEVLVEVWQRAAGYDISRGSVHTWIHTIAHHRAVDRVRSVGAQTERDRRSMVFDRDYDVVAAVVEERREVERVRSALAGLSDVQREAVGLAYYAGHTQAEVAKLLGVPLGTVKSRLRDAVGSLRTRLEVES